jgi:hypothetical protein
MARHAAWPTPGNGAGEQQVTFSGTTRAPAWRVEKSTSEATKRRALRVTGVLPCGVRHVCGTTWNRGPPNAGPGEAGNSHYVIHFTGIGLMNGAGVAPAISSRRR